MLELSLTRLFSATMYYHFAFMAISLALFGSGASGVFIYIVQRGLKPERTGQWLSVAAILFALSNLLSLANDPRVLYISLDRKISPSQSVTVQPGVVLTSANYTVEPINAPQVWAKGYNGTGIGVAVIDSGVTPVDDLSNANGLGYRIVYSQNFVPTTVNVLGLASVSAVLPTNVTDQYGHGTHVAGLIAGNGTDSSGNIGRTLGRGLPWLDL